MIDNIELFQRYMEHCHNATARGIGFSITFNQWLTLWEESGKLDQRGWGKGQYVMARYGDKGDYEVGNVRICLAEENRAERNRNYPLKGEKNAAFGKDYMTPETRERAAERMRKVGLRPKSAATRAAMSKTATGRKRAVIDGRVTWIYPERSSAGVF